MKETRDNNDNNTIDISTIKNTSCNLPSRVKYLPRFLSPLQRSELARETFDSHKHYHFQQQKQQQSQDEDSSIVMVNEDSSPSPAPFSQSSKKLDLGSTSSDNKYNSNGVGSSIESILPNATSHARSAFQIAFDQYIHEERFDLAEEIGRLIGRDNSNNKESSSYQKEIFPFPLPPPLTGTALCYGPHAFMKPHYDSPTSRNSGGDEWLVVLSLGKDVHFRCDSNIIVMEDGDALVMDSAKVLHGVEGVGDMKHTTHSSSTLPSSLSSFSRVVKCSKEEKEEIDLEKMETVLPEGVSRLGLILWGAAVDKEKKGIDSGRNNDDDNDDFGGLSQLFDD